MKNSSPEPQDYLRKMSIKEFLRPTIGIIILTVLFIILILVSYFWAKVQINRIIGVSIPDYRAQYFQICCDSPERDNNMNKTCNELDLISMEKCNLYQNYSKSLKESRKREEKKELLLLITSFFISYFISCLIFWLHNKMREGQLK